MEKKENSNLWVDFTILFALVYQISLPTLTKSSKLREMSKRHLKNVLAQKLYLVKSSEPA